ncbi:hypothetical protein [Streptomyces sp. NPDC005485]|uniref:hypothetical protein n=1 Tax=Streptomyces sp. NPDC005485 TaxID=3155591 RepID=UPI0033B34025
MRRTTPRPTTVLALAASALLLAGCGTQSGDSGSGSSAVTPSKAPSKAPSSSPTAGEKGCVPESSLTAEDTGRTVCLAAGGVLRITLDGTTKRAWKPVSATGDALEATNAGIVIQPGDATAAFTATSAGTAHLTSSRPVCGTDPVHIACKGLQEWTVTVVVQKS